MDLVTCADGGGEDLPAAAPALWALVPDVPDPASMTLLVLALATAAGPTLSTENYRLVQNQARKFEVLLRGQRGRLQSKPSETALVQACYQQLTQRGAPDGPQQQ